MSEPDAWCVLESLIGTVDAWPGWSAGEPDPKGAVMTLPMVTLPVPGKFRKFGDAMICEVCNLDARYCPGHEPPPASVAQDGAAAKALDVRIRDAQGAAMRIGFNDPWRTFCAACNCVIDSCRADGCDCKGK